MKDNRELWIPEENASKWPGILIRSAIVLAILAVIIVVIIKLNPSEEEKIARGVEKIREWENRDVAKAEKEIRSIREQWSEGEAEEIAAEAEGLKTRYQDASALIMGDSIANGLSDYGILDSTSLVLSNGTGIAGSGTELDQALTMAPWNFIVAYGLNDVVNYSGDANAFEDDMNASLDIFKAMRPNADVFICEITPVSDEAIEKNPVYKYIRGFNEALMHICKDNGYHFIETHDLVTEYSGDGVIPSYDFYTPFATRIIEMVEMASAQAEPEAPAAETTATETTEE